jgi:ADP-heptose:LPS heptosyltransferase
MPSKKWAAIRYLDVYRRLYEKHGFMPLFFGSNADRTEAGELLHTIGFGYNFCGLTIRESAAVMQRCDFYLGNDTGTMHLAAAEGLRCVAVFSARSNPGVWEPIGSGHRVLRADVPCEGCELTHCSVHKMLCLELISVEAVYDACLEILK